MEVSVFAGVSVLHKLRRNQGNAALGGLSWAPGARQWK